ncbi:cytokine-inducible SH2-containing protein-like [Antennarius striatus]|uniref:cytokine-inducible SH2-containing protein-like n=1 Tax=Antennarius striatus TaxID=241820 RepID=UPI0035B49F00
MVARAVTEFHDEQCSNSSPPPWDPAQDLCSITTTFQYLQTSGWYWGSISVSDARDALLNKREGTFLIRDSSHPHYMLTLSVQTCCGPTSVRIKYIKGSFWLDSISPNMPHLQSFPDVLSLVQHYMSLGHAPHGQASTDIHPKTKPDPAKQTAKDNGVPLKLMHPLYKLESFPSLQHLTRLNINKHTNCPEQLPLPNPLLRYLHDYPFHI